MELIAIDEHPITMIKGDTLELTITLWDQQINQKFIADKEYRFTRLESYLLTKEDMKELEVNFNIFTEGYDESGNVIRVSQSSWSG